VHLQLEKSVRSVGLNNRQMYLTEQEEMQIQRLIVMALCKAATVNETFIYETVILCREKGTL